MVSPPSLRHGDRLAGRTLGTLRAEYRFWLFEDFLPFMDRHVVDHALGGFMCQTDRDGRNLSGRKRTSYEGRGIWVYSFLHGEIRADPAYLDVARRSVEFILAHEPTGPELLPRGFSREGIPLARAPDDSIYGDIFVATGLQEYSKASGQASYWDMARSIVFKCVDVYDHRDGYQDLPAADGTPAVIRPRILGHWFVLLDCTTRMLAQREDPAIRTVNDRCVGAIVGHVDADSGLLSEYRHHDLSRIRSRYGQRITGHAIEVSWMLLREARRRGDAEIFRRGAALLQRHLEAMWDDVYGGLFLALDVDARWRDVRKFLWVQEEALIGALLVFEQTGARWAEEWFGRIYEYVLERFPLARHGYSLWSAHGDRRVTFEPHASRVEHFHHPRHLMLNLQALDRMVGPAG
jgi:mannose/cellobiose epimerase-like protein (N-acyl-D-glucosamine 2-epimerase family)